MPRIARLQTMKRLVCLSHACLLLAVVIPGRLTAADDKTTDITFDTLKFEIKKGGDFKRSMLTEQIEALDGKMVRVRGYILPSFQQEGIKQFVLVRDNMECCFGPGAALYDCILVEMESDKSISYTVRPVAVEGKLAIREFKGPDDKPLAVYYLTGKTVK